MVRKSWKADGTALRIPGYATLVIFDKPSHARKASASPEMLDALKAALPYFVSGAVPHIQEQIRAAIGKAEGK